MICNRIPKSLCQFIIRRLDHGMQCNHGSLSDFPDYLLYNSRGGKGTKKDLELLSLSNSEDEFHQTLRLLCFDRAFSDSNLCYKSIKTPGSDDQRPGPIPFLLVDPHSSDVLEVTSSDATCIHFLTLVVPQHIPTCLFLLTTP